jgi:hypothetical protein
VTLLTSVSMMTAVAAAEMRIEQVFERAHAFAARDRWTIWRACGTHNFGALPETEPAGERQPIRYCPICWTLFGASGQPLNAPAGFNRLFVNEPS